MRSSPNARFILTTRAYIFEEARRVSEHLADRRLEIAKYVLDVEVYDRRIRARILYNHLVASGTPQAHIASLINSGSLVEVVDHEHYNPRLIEWMTDISHVHDIPAADYPRQFKNLLDHPTRLWDIAFRTHISKACQHLLLTLYFCSEYGVSVDVLRINYRAVHSALSAKYGDSHDPKDFEEALRILEGGFVSIEDGTVTFINPSLRDYLAGYVNDFHLLCDLARAAVSTKWAAAVWEQGKQIKERGNVASLAAAFDSVAAQFAQEPIYMYALENNVRIGRAYGLNNVARIDLLICWWFEAKEDVFAETALSLSEYPIGGLDSWRDGEEVVGLMGKLRDDGYYGEFPNAARMADLLEQHFIGMLETGMPGDELENVSDAVERWRYALSTDALEAVDAAIRSEIANVGEAISDIDSESTLNDYAGTLRKLGARASVSAVAIEHAVEAVEKKREWLEDTHGRSNSPSVGLRSSEQSDAFDDDDLRALFAPLLQPT